MQTGGWESRDSTQQSYFAEAVLLDLGVIKTKLTSMAIKKLTHREVIELLILKGKI